MNLFAQLSRGDFPNIPQPPDPNAGLPLAEMMQFIFGVIGVIAIIMVMVGGFKYITSQGNPQETAKAKNTILYAIIGLVLAASSFTIVSFVVGTVDAPPQQSQSPSGAN